MNPAGLAHEGLNARTLLLALSGSIAAYKGVELARALGRRGFRAQALLTAAAQQFVGKATLLGITGLPVYDTLFDGAPGERHIELWRNACAMVIAPASADVLARLAQGRADDLVSATALCRRGPLFIAPAMHPRMWANAAVQRNVRQLISDGCVFLGPVEGEVASGDSGLGRLMEPEELATRIVSALQTRNDLAGLRVVVSAGPTVEDLDPVRFISNRSSGKMGYAIAQAAHERGAQVELVSGPVTLMPPQGPRLHAVRSASEMLDTLRPLVADADALVMAAAVGDFRVSEPSSQKLKKPAAGAGLQLQLVQNPDILRTLSVERNGQRPALVAFAVETGTDAEIEQRARKKLADKGVDLVVANAAEDSFGRDDNRVQFVSAQHTESLARMSKAAVANALLDRLKALLERNASAAQNTTSRA